MSKPTAIGTPPWTRADLRAALAEFAQLYASRPLANNHGGMRSAHMFATWFVARTLQPEVIVESGVFKGQGSWLLHQACPDARMICIDPAPEQLEHRLTQAEYLTEDWSTREWAELPRERTLLFFDDHQDAMTRIRRAQQLGFRHTMFEDNYPPECGDCYSLKKAFAGAGFAPKPPPTGWLGSIGRALRNQRPSGSVAANMDDAAFLHEHLAVYCELPPILQPSHTRWGDAWDARYPTPEPLLAAAVEPHEQVFADEAQDYTWICYAQLKPRDGG